MSFVRYLLIITGIFLLSACQPEGKSPFSIDTTEGSFTLQQDGKVSGPILLELNGIRALENAHIFQGKDSLVVISSVTGLDLISVFKLKGEQALMQISVINPTDSSLEISKLNINLKAEKSESLWQWENAGPEGKQGCFLKLSGSSILLLPEERIELPPLHFFSHLCADKASP